MPVPEFSDLCAFIIQRRCFLHRLPKEAREGGWLLPHGALAVVLWPLRSLGVLSLVLRGQGGETEGSQIGTDAAAAQGPSAMGRRQGESLAAKRAV